jgi:hypothetical protein
VRTLRTILTVATGGVLGAFVLAAPASAGTISSPGSPWSVPSGANGVPAGGTDISVSGFKPNSQVYLEQCDGLPPTAPNWSPTTHCDNGTSPAAGIVDSNGQYTFKASDRNHAFTPFKGSGPSGSFDCLSANDQAPHDGLPQYRNCQLRASTNNATITSDQAFITLQLPDATAQTPEVPVAIALPIVAIAAGGAFLLYTRRRAARAGVRS